MGYADVLLTALGTALILVLFTDVFRTLLYPRGTGPVCRLIMRGLWLLARKLSGHASTVAAPAAMAAVIGTWTAMAVLGWSLVYLPQLETGFSYQGGVARKGDFPEAVYVSMVSLSTVGYGEIVAAKPPLRLLTAFQALTGLGMMTAAVSWILQTYPALGRRRALAHRLNLFREAAGPEGVSSLEPAHAAALLESLAENVALVSIDLTQFNESYYFYEPEQRNSLAANLYYVQQLAGDAQESRNAELRFAGRMLAAALEDFAGVLRGGFGHSGEEASVVFESYALHHRHRF